MNLGLLCWNAKCNLCAFCLLEGRVWLSESTVSASVKRRTNNIQYHQWVKWSDSLKNLIPIAHLGASFSWLSTWCKSKPDLSVLLLTCSLQALLLVDRSQLGISDWSVATQSHMQQAVMHCLFWPFYQIQHWLFSTICAIVALLWHQTRLASLHSSCALVSLGCTWPCNWFTKCPFLDQFW